VGCGEKSKWARKISAKKTQEREEELCPEFLAHLDFSLPPLTATK